MALSVKEFLKQALPEDLYEILKQASVDWSEPIFARDPQTGAFECTLSPDFDSDLDSDLESDFVDAACFACDALSESGHSFDGDPAVAGSEKSAGSIKLEYQFSLDEEREFEVFQGLLEEMTATDAGIEGQFQKYPWGFAAYIHLRFQSDIDYQRKKDAIDWLRQVARMRANRLPIRGSKL